MSEIGLHIDNWRGMEWDQGEELSEERCYDKTYKVTSTMVRGKRFYEVEATGHYSCGDLINVTDFEVVSVENLVPEDGGQ